MKTIFSSPPLRARVGAASTPVVSLTDADMLAKQLRDGAAKDAATAAARRTEIDDKLKSWGKEFAWAGGGSLILAGAAIVALDAIDTISKIFSGNPDSEEWQRYATNAYKQALLDGWIPRTYDPDLYFAKDYANFTVAGNEQFDRWIGKGYGWNEAWQVARTNQIVQSAAVAARGWWYDQDMDNFKSNPVKYGKLATFVAAVASVRFGIPLASAIQTALSVPIDTTHGIGSGWKFQRDAWIALSKGQSGGGSSSSIVTPTTVAVGAGGGYLAYKFVWPWLKGRLFK